jgi:hypothetical protein
VDADSPAFRERLTAEIQAARGAARFCIAPVLAADLDAGRPWIAAEYVEGPSLDEVVGRDGPLPASFLEALAVGVAGGLAALHAAGVAHRDLKPSNVVLGPVGPRVVDFGMAEAMQVTVGLTAARPAPGSGAYVAPEQHAGREPGPPADIFAWGATIAFAGTGRPPFGSGSAASVAWRAVHEPPDLHGLDPGLRGILERAMATDPAARPTARRLLEWLTGGVPEQVAGAGTRSVRHRKGLRSRPARPRPRRRRRSRRTRVVAVVCAGLLVLAAAGAAVAARRPDGPVAPDGWNPPPELVAAGPLVSEDFADPSDWPEYRADEDHDDTVTAYTGGGYAVRSTTRIPELLGPVRATDQAVEAHAGTSSRLAEAHQAIDVRWAGGSRWGSVILSCRNSFGPEFQYTADGTWAVVFGRGGEHQRRLAAGGPPAGSEPRPFHRIEATCKLGADKNWQLAMWVDGTRVATAGIRDTGSFTDVEAKAGVVTQSGAELNVVLDNYVMWGDTPRR